MLVNTLPADNPDLQLRSGVVVCNHVNGCQYRVAKQLGTGGFGAAYRVIELSSSGNTISREYCLKITANPEGWYREAYFGDLLRNVIGVIQVYEAFAWVPHRTERKPLYCLVTKLAEGGDVASWLKTNRAPWKESVAGWWLDWAPCAREGHFVISRIKAPGLPAIDQAARIRSLHSVRTRLEVSIQGAPSPDWPGFIHPPYFPGRSFKKDQSR